VCVCVCVCVSLRMCVSLYVYVCLCVCDPETEHPVLEQEHPILRTSPERVAKMLIIVLGISIVGAAIFFGLWDYWTSAPPAAGAGTVVEISAPVTFTGKEIPTSLSFIESSDFRTLAFNALPGEPDNNPEIHAGVGDKITFDVINDGKSFHAFGVTSAEEGLSGIIPGSDIASASSPLKPGESGQSEFIPGEEGVYYYICTVPGHREQGMVGKIIVGDVSEDVVTEAIKEPEPVMVEEPKSISSAVPAPGFEDVPEMIVVEEPTSEPIPEGITEFTGTISVPTGSSAPGCDELNECYIPAQVAISVGDTVTWSNDDSAAHTVTSGTPNDGPDGKFDSSLFMAGTTFEVTFDTAGEYDYFCMVHPWMTGKVQVG